MGHTYSNFLVHVVFSTKHRAPSIHDSFRERLYDYMGGIARAEFGRALKIGGIDNHIHGLLGLRTNISIADALQKWKSLSSGWIHETISNAPDFAWQVGYSAFTVSESMAPRVIRYIENQAEHHRKQTFEEELIALLEKHGVEYDPNDLWD